MGGLLHSRSQHRAHRARRAPLSPAVLRGAGLTAADRAAEDRQVRAWALALLFLAGATIGLISLLLPHGPRADTAGLYANVAIAYAVGAGALLLGSGAGRAVAHAAVALATVQITWTIVLSGDPESFYAVWFFWVGLYAVYFFGRAAAGAHLALVGVLYAYALAHLHAPSGLARWLTTIATLLIAGVFSDMLVRHARGQTAAAETSASTMTLAAETAHRLAALGDWKEARATLCEMAVQVAEADGVALWEPSVDPTKLRVSAEFRRGPDRREIEIGQAGRCWPSTGTRPSRPEPEHGHGREPACGRGGDDAGASQPAGAPGTTRADG